MTEDNQEPEPEETTAEQVQRAFGSLSGDLRASGEGRVALAGILLVAVWLVFDVIIDNYGIDNTLAVLGASAVIVQFLKRETIAPIPKALVMKALGYLIAMFGVIELILDLRFGVYDNTGVVIGALLAYVAFVVAFLGARAIKLKA